MKPGYKIAISLSVCLFFAANVAANGQAKTEREADDTLNRARAAYRQRDYDTAKKELKLAHAARKDWPEAYLLDALIAWQEKDNEKATRLAKHAIKLEPSNAAAFYLLTRIYFQRQSFKEAENSIQQAIKLGIQSADAFVLSGDIALALGEIENALTAYEKAINQPGPRTELTGEFDKRLQAIRNTVEIKKHNGDELYSIPKFAGKDLPEHIGPVTRTWGGVIDDQGKYTDGIVLYTGLATTGNSFQLKAGKVVKYNPVFWEFSPAKLNGKPVLYWAYVTFSPSGIYVK